MLKAKKKKEVKQKEKKRKKKKKKKEEKKLQHKIFAAEKRKNICHLGVILHQGVSSMKLSLPQV